ncbi:MAG: hypothetical protein Ct9H300mP31_17860 [Acidimicrobiaceae bacterium]|nr:MAG: hypothetical protein Ct9H300mP31_17860 [Acidimicrobiaceae bacterium]
MAAVNEAWRVLRDRKRRAAYDLARRPAEPPIRAPPDDGPIPGRRGDSFQAVTVSPAVGCALRFGPMVLGVGLLVGILVATAVLGGGGEVPKRLEPGSCLELSTTVRVVPCTAETPVMPLGVLQAPRARSGRWLWSSRHEPNRSASPPRVRLWADR